MKICQRGHEYEASRKCCPVCKDVKDKEWHLEHKEQKDAKEKEWKLKNKEQNAANQKAWELANPDYHRKYQANRLATDPLYKLANTIRSLIHKSLKNKGHKKNSKTHNILGCDYETFHNHLIVTALKRYGYWVDIAGYYHIDHDKPVSSATTEEEMLTLNRYTNLQLLYPEHNRAKGDKLDWTIPIAISDSNS